MSSDGLYVTMKKVSELEVKSLSELADHCHPTLHGLAVQAGAILWPHSAHQVQNKTLTLEHLECGWLPPVMITTHHFATFSWGNLEKSVSLSFIKPYLFSAIQLHPCLVSKHPASAHPLTSVLPTTLEIIENTQESREPSSHGQSPGGSYKSWSQKKKVFNRSLKSFGGPKEIHRSLECPLRLVWWFCGDTYCIHRFRSLLR